MRPVHPTDDDSAAMRPNYPPVLPLWAGVGRQLPWWLQAMPSSHHHDHNLCATAERQYVLQACRLASLPRGRRRQFCDPVEQKPSAAQVVCLPHFRQRVRVLSPPNPSHWQLHAGDQNGRAHNPHRRRLRGHWFGHELWLSTHFHERPQQRVWLLWRGVDERPAVKEVLRRRP